MVYQQAPPRGLLAASTHHLITHGASEGPTTSSPTRRTMLTTETLSTFSILSHQMVAVGVEMVG